MDLVIGTDEAGYGPNLGPLTIGATAWWLEDGAADLFEVLSHVYGRVGESSSQKITVGDSKQLFQPGAGLAKLEQAVLPLATLCAQTGGQLDVLAWSEFCKLVAPNDNLMLGMEHDNEPVSMPWYQGFDPVVPLDLSEEQVSDSAKIHQFENLNRPLLQRVRWVEPGMFNRGCEQLGNKATLLSHATLSLAKGLVSDVIRNNELRHGLPVQRVFLQCDKHGGRNSYAGILQSFYEDCWVQVIEESRESSAYRFTYEGIEYHWQFLAKGESHLPIALASMFAKYCREVSMEAFNRYWLNKDKSLKPTAGYPLDAKRFRKDIDSLLPDLGLEESHWWRFK